MAQLNLIFTDFPLPQTQLWEQFDQAQKQVLIEILTRLMVKAARTRSPEELDND
jgi:phenylpyruvate tautomerase PptA (4-oxalocrotonate tautomerase family)